MAKHLATRNFLDAQHNEINQTLQYLFCLDEYLENVEEHKHREVT